MTFETEDVSVVKTIPKKTGLTQALYALIDGRAVFVSSNGRSLNRTQSAVLTVGNRILKPEYKIHTKQDKTKNGIWAWWEKSK